MTLIENKLKQNVLSTVTTSQITKLLYSLLKGYQPSGLGKKSNFWKVYKSLMNKDLKSSLEFLAR